MEDNHLSSHVIDGRITGMRFNLATDQEICTSSISDCAISHSSQLRNPFLGLPLESGKCESCGTAEPGKCDGHFGYIELPIPIFHPSHVSELKKLLSLVCLKCLKMKGKIRHNGESGRSSNIPCSYCPDVPKIYVEEKRTKDGAIFLQLKVPSRSRLLDGHWNFLEKYGFRYGDDLCRPLLPIEVLEILKRIPEETGKKLAGKGYLPQDGYILQKVPVPPNCLSVPDISDGTSIMSSDLSASMLKKVLKQIEIIKKSRSGPPNFMAHEVEANDLQLAVAQYLHVRGTTKASHDTNARFGVSKETNESSTKAWLEKMRTLFIRKGSGFSSRSVITGDAYKRVNEIGLPLEIAQKITFEEKVTERNRDNLQELVDHKFCLTYKDGVSTYSLREGSTGHTSLKVGQVLQRRIMDGDIVFINRPPSTHKHSLQAFSVYIHNDHTVKINPLICGPLGADFDGDCVHLFYPQSLAAKAEVLELFSVEQQLLSSHSGNLNLQLANDALLSLNRMFEVAFFDKATAQQLAMFVSPSLGPPALLKSNCTGSRWTALQILQTALPARFTCIGERHLISQSEIMKVDFNRDVLQSLFSEIISSVFFKKGSKDALEVFNSLQPLLMENMFLEGYSVCLKDFSIPKSITEDLRRNVQDVSPLLHHLRSTYNELVELQVENHLRSVKVAVVNFILKLSALGNLIDSKSESSINKVVQQLGFLGLQLYDRGKFYSRTLVEDMTSFFHSKFAVSGVDYPSEAFGLIKSCFFQGLNPYEELVHSISSREVLVRSSRGLTEPGTLFKNLMAILRDVVICYDGTVRNVCSNSIIQFEYGEENGTNSQSSYPAGEPVGVLAATAISNPAYKAVLDSSPSSNSSWELMKEILLCKVTFKNDLNACRVILYLNDCACGKKYCKENAAFLVRNQLKKVSLKDIAVNFLVEYKQRVSPESSTTNAALVGHIHLDKKLLKDLDRSMHEVLLECQETISSFRKKKNLLGQSLKRIFLSVSECCCFQQSCDSEWSQIPCLQFSWQDTSSDTLENISQIMANMICPILLGTIVKGDPRVYSANIIWISPDTTTWVRNPCRTQKGELALEIVLEKAVVKQNGDAWRIVLDSCLPVFHLIDTRRSIPYAIKQVQDLLGISCAFDQVVKRLSTSVKMVAKGVLKEHLTLVANSMTCTGNLIGFNSGGYKALFRSLNVQVPFTEATLFTPRKCFERAAEKCHMDSLSSIVASCCWGKHVAVGTGARFDILWDKKEMGLNKDGGIDVYNFLQLVRSSDERESNTACLGGEIDDLETEDGDLELGLSPEYNFDDGRPIFDDSAEVQYDQGKTLEKEKSSESNWETNSSLIKQSNGSREWKVGQPLNIDNGNAGMTMPKPSVWPGWGTDKVQTQVSPSTKPSEESPPRRSGGWNTMESQKWPSQSSDPADTWGTLVEADKIGQNKNDGKSQWPSQSDMPKKWPSHSSDPAADTWGTLAETDKTGQNKNDGKSQWPSQSSDPSADTWGTLAEADKTGQNKNEGKSQWPSQSSDPSADTWGILADADKTGQNKNDGKSQWSSQSSDPSAGTWGTLAEADKTGLNKNDGKSQWGQWKDSTKPSEESPRYGGWNISESQKRPQVEEPGETWGRHATEEADVTGGNQNDGNPQWGQWRESHTKPSEESPSYGGWNIRKLEKRPCDAWGQQDGEEGTGGWNKSEGKSQSSNAGDWKIKKGRAAMSPGKFDDRNDWSASGIFTATRQRLDQFTSEEQNILSDVEPILQSIKRIMHQSRYNDGDPLTTDDQSYVLDHVFNYHPDKTTKMGSGVDYVMVNKHSSFQDTRCFYIVSTDGHREDFSYRKCMENFVKDKYPGMAESFIKKYFRKPRSGNPTPEEGMRLE